MNTIDSTKLIELAKADYKMLKEKGKEGEEVLHYNGFLDGFARGLHEASNPWHKVSEELPKENGLYLARFEKAEGGIFIDIFDFYDNHFMDWRAIEGKYTHWMEIPEIKED